MTIDAATLMGGLENHLVKIGLWGSVIAEDRYAAEEDHCGIFEEDYQWKTSFMPDWVFDSCQLQWQLIS